MTNDKTNNKMDKAALWSGIVLFATLVIGNTELVLIAASVFAGIIIAWYLSTGKKKRGIIWTIRKILHQIFSQL